MGVFIVGRLIRVVVAANGDPAIELCEAGLDHLDCVGVVPAGLLMAGGESQKGDGEDAFYCT